MLFLPSGIFWVGSSLFSLDLFSSTQNDPKWGPNCADDVRVRGTRFVQEHHEHNWDPILA